MVVEDDPLVAQALKEGLERYGCRVIGPAHTPESALRMVREPDVSFALLDVNLGGEADSGIADHLSSRDVPFIFLSGYDPETLPERFRAKPFLRKPHRIGDLAGLMARLIHSEQSQTVASL